MMMRPRSGLAVLAVATALGTTFAFINARLFARAAEQGHYELATKVASVLHWLWWGLVILSALGAVAAAGTWARTAGRVAAGAFAANLVARGLQEIAIHRMRTTGDFESSFLRVAGSAGMVARGAAFGALVLIMLAAGRAARARAPSLVGAVAAGLLAVLDLLAAVEWLVRADSATYNAIWTGLSRVASLAFVVGAGWLAVAIGRATPEEPGAPASDSRLGREWRTVADGITLYLGAVAVRVLCALASYGALAEAKSMAGSYGALRGVGDSIVGIAFVSAIATFAAIGGLVMIGRAPAPSADTRMYTSGASVCLVFALLLDAAGTSLTAKALGGSLSAAFTAMDALPIFAAVSTGLGVITASCILLALARIADDLTLSAVAARARQAVRVAVIAGSAGTLLQLAMKAIPSELFIMGALVVAPALLFAAIQLLRVMLAVGGAIRARTAP
ncbi:MAG: hypothetical protein KIT84_24685 [Labilithrix sp.]|nr:hypothetical protein [Labilithrix sp.]MCW5814247.1 hypothetical protein [Labilithrix sp.]